jgi:hypothetical protein
MDFANFLSCSRRRLTTLARLTTAAPSQTLDHGAPLKQVQKTGSNQWNGYEI